MIASLATMGCHANRGGDETDPSLDGDGRNNIPPTADSLAFSTDEDTPVAILLSGSDGDRDDLSFVIETAPTNGALTETETGWTYTPNPDFNGNDSFEFAATDGKTASVPSRVTLTVYAVNDPPMLDEQTTTTPEDIPVGIDLSVHDPEGDPLTWSVHTAPSNGTLQGDPPNLVFVPDADWFGSDWFTIQAFDGEAWSTPAQVDVVVTPENDAPTAVDLSIEVDAGQTVQLPLQGSDIDGDAIAFEIVSPPDMGSVTESNGDWWFTAAAGDNGPADFTYRAVDPDGATSDTAEVVVDIDGGPRVPTTEAFYTGGNTEIDIDLSDLVGDVGGEITDFEWIDVGPSFALDDPTGRFRFRPPLGIAHQSYRGTLTVEYDDGTTIASELTLHVLNLVRHVSPSGSPTASGTSWDPYDEPEQPVFLSGVDEWVYIEAGTYQMGISTLNTDTGTHIVGEGADLVLDGWVIRQAGDRPLLETSGNAVASLGPVEVAGLDFLHTTGSGAPAITVSNTTSAHVRHVSLDGYNDGLSLYRVDEVTVVGLDALDVGATGLDISQADSVTLSEVHVEGGNTALILYRVDAAIVDDFDSVDTLAYGIDASNDDPAIDATLTLNGQRSTVSQRSTGVSGCG